MSRDMCCGRDLELHFFLKVERIFLYYGHIYINVYEPLHIQLLLNFCREKKTNLSGAP